MRSVEEEMQRQKEDAFARSIACFKEDDPEYYYELWRRFEEQQIEKYVWGY